jgi:hypothetical protein
MKKYLANEIADIVHKVKNENDINLHYSRVKVKRYFTLHPHNITVQ